MNREPVENEFRLIYISTHMEALLDCDREAIQLSRSSRKKKVINNFSNQQNELVAFAMSEYEELRESGECSETVCL